MQRRVGMWYSKTENPDNRAAGKVIFLKSMGIELLEEEDYKSIYETPWL